MSDDRYCRVHFDRIAVDPKFDGIREDPTMFGSWLLLLIEAEKAWPSPAFPHPWVPRRAYKVLVEHGLIDVMPNRCYRVHGLDAIRGARRKQAEDAAAVRWGNAPSNADSNATVSDTGMPSKAKQSNSKAVADQPRAERAESADPADTYWTLTGKYPTDKTLAWIDDLTEQFGAETVIRHLAEEHVTDRDARTLMGRVTDLCRRDGRALSVKERAVEKERIAERRVDPAVVRARHQTGQHQDAPDESCAMCKGDAA